MKASASDRSVRRNKKSEKIPGGREKGEENGESGMVGPFLSTHVVGMGEWKGDRLQRALLYYKKKLLLLHTPLEICG